MKNIARAEVQQTRKYIYLGYWTGLLFGAWRARDWPHAQKRLKVIGGVYRIPNTRRLRRLVKEGYEPCSQ